MVRDVNAYGNPRLLRPGGLEVARKFRKARTFWEAFHTLHRASDVHSLAVALTGAQHGYETLMAFDRSFAKETMAFTCIGTLYDYRHGSLRGLWSRWSILRETRSGRPRQRCRSTRLRFASAAPRADLVAPNLSTPRLAFAGPGPREPFADQLVAERASASCHDPELAPVPVFITPL